MDDRFAFNFKERILCYRDDVDVVVGIDDRCCVKNKCKAQNQEKNDAKGIRYVTREEERKMKIVRDD